MGGDGESRHRPSRGACKLVLGLGRRGVLHGYLGRAARHARSGNLLRDNGGGARDVRICSPPTLVWGLAQSGDRQGQLRSSRLASLDIVGRCVTLLAVAVKGAAVESLFRIIGEGMDKVRQNDEAASEWL